MVEETKVQMVEETKVQMVQTMPQLQKLTERRPVVTDEYNREVVV
jgi:hypothetical protein